MLKMGMEEEIHLTGGMWQLEWITYHKFHKLVSEEEEEESASL